MGTKMIIPAGEKGPESGVSLGNTKLIGIIMPAEWTAANLNVSVATSLGGTYYQLTDETGTPIALTVAAKKAVAFKTYPAVLAPWQFIKLESTETQEAEREIILVTKG